MNWKEQAWLWFTRAAQFWLAQTLIFYFGACVVAGQPIGPKDYVRFGYHVIQWKAGQYVRLGAFVDGLNGERRTR
jgi:hypothetical protein